MLGTSAGDVRENVLLAELSSNSNAELARIGYRSPIDVLSMFAKEKPASPPKHGADSLAKPGPLPTWPAAFDG
jgi:hypothetical protein